MLDQPLHPWRDEHIDRGVCFIPIVTGTLRQALDILSKPLAEYPLLA